MRRVWRYGELRSRRVGRTLPGDHRIEDRVALLARVVEGRRDERRVEELFEHLRVQPDALRQVADVQPPRAPRRRQRVLAAQRAAELACELVLTGGVEQARAAVQRGHRRERRAAEAGERAARRRHRRLHRRRVGHQAHAGARLRHRRRGDGGGDRLRDDRLVELGRRRREVVRPRDAEVAVEQLRGGGGAAVSREGWWRGGGAEPRVWWWSWRLPASRRGRARSTPRGPTGTRRSRSARRAPCGRR